MISSPKVFVLYANVAHYLPDKRQDGRFLILLRRQCNDLPVDLLRVIDDYATTDPTVSIENLDTDRIDIYTAATSKAGGAGGLAFEPGGVSMCETRFGTVQRMDQQNIQILLHDRLSLSFLEYHQGKMYLRDSAYIPVTVVLTRVGSIMPRHGDTGFLVLNQMPVELGRVWCIHYSFGDKRGIARIDMSNHCAYYWTGSATWISNPGGGFGKLLFFVKA